MRAIRLSAALVLVSGLGCSLLLSAPEPSQCESPRDCDAIPALRGRVCEQGFCVPPAVVDAAVDAARPPEGCSSAELCTKANSGKASVCREAGGPCTPWETAQCDPIRGEWKDPNAIVIGTILPFHVTQANGALVPYPYTKRLQRAIDLGLEELNAALPDGVPVPGGARRPFAVLHCDSYYDAALAVDAMTHLTDVVGAQAIIVGSDHDLAAIRPQALATKTPVVCSDCVGPFPPGPLAWRVVPPLAQEAAMAAWRVGDLEERIMSGRAPSAMKVAVLATPDPGPASFVAALIPKLRFNGKSAAENGSAFTVRTTADPTKQAMNYVADADALAAFEPDVLVVAMGADFPAKYLQLLETKWTTTKPRPHYIMTALSFEVAPFANVIGPADEDVLERLSGTRPAFHQALERNIEAYTLRYRQRYNFERPDGNFSAYDAFYATAYAASAAASTEIVLDGPRIDAAFGRLRTGTPIDVGPKQLEAGLALLGAQAGSIDLRGHASELDWDVATRDLVVTEFGMYCFGRDGDGALVLRVDAGPTLNTTTNVVTGSYACE